MKLLWIKLIILCLSMNICQAWYSQSKGTRTTKPRKINAPSSYVYVSNWAQYKFPAKVDIEIIKNILHKLALYKKLEYCPFENNSSCKSENLGKVVRKIVEDETKNVSKTQNTVALNDYPYKRTGKSYDTIIDGLIFKSDRSNLKKDAMSKPYPNVDTLEFGQYVFPFALYRSAYNTSASPHKYQSNKEDKKQKLYKKPHIRLNYYKQKEKGAMNSLKLKKSNLVKTLKFKPIGGRKLQQEYSETMKGNYLDFQIIF